MLALPARIDLISVPVSTSPASNVSSIVNSWRAFRLRATVESSRTDGLPRYRVDRSEVGGRFPGGHPPEDSPERTNAGPIRTGVRVAYPPTGCPTRRPSPARWCSYAYCRSLHITSFRSPEPYPNTVMSASMRSWRRKGLCGRPPGPPSCRSAKQLQSSVQDRIAVGIGLRGPLDRDLRLKPDVVDPAPARGQPTGDRQAERAALARQLLPLLDGPLAERRLAHEGRPPGVLQGPGDDLAGGRTAPVDQAHDPDVGARGHTARLGIGGDLPAGRILFPEDGPGRDELAGHRTRRRHVPAGIAAEVEDEPGPVGFQVAAQGGRQFQGAAIGEAVEPDVADGPLGVGAGHDFLRQDHVAGDLERERLPVRALDAERDGAAPRSADQLAGAVHAEPIERHAVRRQDDVPAPQARPRGWRAGEWRHDHEAALRAERRTALGAVRRLGRDLDADALELAADPLEGVVVLLRGEIRGVGVPERVDHPADGALHDRVAVDLAA